MKRIFILNNCIPVVVLAKVMTCNIKSDVIHSLYSSVGVAERGPVVATHSRSDPNPGASPWQETHKGRCVDSPDGSMSECLVRRALYDVQSPGGRGVRWEWAPLLAPPSRAIVRYEPMPMEMQGVVESAWAAGAGGACGGWRLSPRRGVAAGPRGIRLLRRSAAPPYPRAMPIQPVPPAPPPPAVPLAMYVILIATLAPVPTSYFQLTSVLHIQGSVGELLNCSAGSDDVFDSPAHCTDCTDNIPETVPASWARNGVGDGVVNGSGGGTGGSWGAVCPMCVARLRAGPGLLRLPATHVRRQVCG
ncbi:hypothetical protein evm_002524 [Chilo suppressalis]|nr:hypothetical protein evm_002524 [Chilo suppressalis]